MGSKIGCILCTLVFALSCGHARLSATSVEANDHASIVGYDLSLESRQDQCVLMYSDNNQNGEVILQPKPPCYFIRDWNGKLQSFTYDDIGNAVVFIVIGTPPEGESSLPADKKCGTESQGVIIKDRKVKLSERIGRGGLKCAAGGLDETEFWLFSHE